MSRVRFVAPRLLVALCLLGVGYLALAGVGLVGADDAEATAATTNASESCATNPDSEPCVTLSSETGDVHAATATLAVASLETAAEAAAAFASRPQFMMYATNNTLPELIDADTTDGGRRDLWALTRTELVVVRDALATAAPASTWFVVRPLSASVTNLDVDAGTAEASVWSTQLFSRVGVTDPEQLFTVTDMSLVWNGDRWLLDGFVSRPGPAARLAAEQFPVTAPELETRLDGHLILDPYPLSIEGVG